MRRFLKRQQLLHEWQYSKKYWILLRHWKIIHFRVNNNLFIINRLALQIRNSISMLGEFINLAKSEMVFVILLIAALELLDHLRLSLGLTITQLLPITFNIESQSYRNSLITFAQLAGVFLGLYITAVNVVASTIYSRASGDVRSLFIKTTGESFYLRLVVFFLMTDMISILMSTLGHQLGNLNLLLIIVLGFLIILGFFEYGIKSFHLFDPARLAYPLIPDIWEWTQAVSVTGFKWQEESFQKVNQRNAEGALNTYYNVVQMAGNAAHLQLDSLKNLGINALNLFQFYSGIKHCIPSESFWFRRTFQHRDWLTSESSTRDLALQTGTSIQPEEKPDMMWFESYIEKITIDSLGNLIDRKDYINAYKLEKSICLTLDVLAQNLSIDEAFHLFNLMKGPIFIQVHNSENNLIKLIKDKDEFRLIIGLVDLYGLAFISILLGLSRRIRLMNSESFGSSINDIQWDRPDTVYRNAFPRPVIQRLEQIQKGIIFELYIEGYEISPQWYLQQLAAQSLISFFSLSLEKLMVELESSFTKEVGLLIKEERYIIAAQLIQRGIEACSKFEANFEDAKVSIGGFDSFRKIDDIQWAMPEWGNFLTRINITRENLVMAYAQSLDSLVKIEPIENFPDYFGQGIFLVAKECYSAMVSGNEEKFNKIFPSFFYACLSARDREFVRLENQDSNVRFIISNEPIMNLFAISGSAIIYSELDSKNYWKTAKILWDKYYMDNVKDTLELSKFFKIIYDYSVSPYAFLTLMYQHSELRFEWKKELEQQLQDRGLLKDSHTYYSREEESLGSKHPSYIIRTVTRRGLEFDSIEEIFLALYLMKRPEAKEIDWSRSRLNDLATDFAEEAENSTVNGEDNEKA